MLDLGVPDLGICYGMQLLTEAFGGSRRHQHPSRVRARAGAPRGQRPSRLFAGLPVRAEGVGQSRRPRDARARGFCGGGHIGQRAGGRHGGARPRLLRAAVSSGSGAHRARTRGAPELRVRRLRLHGRLDDHVVHRRGHRAHPHTDGHRARRLRPVGRRRFHRRGHAHPPRDRRSADVHLRRQRPAAPERGRARSWSATGSWRCRCTSSTPATSSSTKLDGRHRSRAEAQDHRRHVHRRLQARSRGRSARSTSWPRARSIPT